MFFFDLTKFVEATHVEIPFAEPKQEPACRYCKYDKSQTNSVSQSAQIVGIPTLIQYTFVKIPPAFHCSHVIE